MVGVRFKFNTILTTLVLSNNRIGDEGAKALADALKDTRTSAFQYLRSNVGDWSAIVLVDALEYNNTLAELLVDANEIGNEGAIALANAYNDNSTLELLELSENLMGIEVAEGIRRMGKD